MTQTDGKAKELAVLKCQLIDVISDLKERHKLEDMMPLVKQLQQLEVIMSSGDKRDEASWSEHGFDIGNVQLGVGIVQIRDKIRFLFSRIHIEGAYLSSINKSIAYVMQRDYKFSDLKQFFREKTYCSEKKKLLVTAFRLLLSDFDTKQMTGLDIGKLTDILLDNIDSGTGTLFKMISDNCQVCQRNHGNNHTTNNQPDAEYSCFCALISTQQPEPKRFSGVLKFRLDCFTGLYDADYLPKLLKGNAPRLIADQYSAGNNDSNKVKRRCVVLARAKAACSNWMNGPLTFSDEVMLNREKEIEIQVWERLSDASKDSVARLVALAIIPIENLQTTLAARVSPGPIPVYLEPAGFLMLEGRLDASACIPSVNTGVSRNIPDSSMMLIDDHIDANKENRPQPLKMGFKLRRRENIFTKLTGFRLARHIEANIPVSVWTDWFQNHIYRLAVPEEMRRKKLGMAWNNKSGRIDQSGDCCRDKALGFNKQKINITSTKHIETKKFGNDSYRIISKSPLPEIIKITPKLNQTNPRTICRFICTKEHFGQNQECLPSTPCSNGKQFHSAVMSTPIHNNIQPFIINITPQKPLKMTENVKSPLYTRNLQVTPKNSSQYYNIKSDPINSQKLKSVREIGNFGNSLLVDKSMTRSNIELNNEPEKLSRLRKSESLYFSKDSSLDQSYHDANIISKSILKSAFSLNTSIDFVPDACTPNLKNIPVCKISSSKKSINHNHRKSSGKHSKTFDDSDLLADKSVDNDNSLFLRSCQPDTNDEEDVADKQEENSDDDDDEEDNDDKELTDSSDEEDDSFENEQNNRYLSIQDLDLLCVLGQGHFGKVVLARNKNTSKLYALKSIQKARASSEAEFDSLVSERRILMMIRESQHPFLIGLVGCFQTERYLLFAMEYASGGDMMGHIHNNTFSEDDARFYAACVVLAFEFLHNNNIIYRDLKLDNVLMDHQGYAKLTDFGLSKENMNWNDTTNTFCGTPEFLAPEIISYKEYTRVIDWWALGVLIYEMVVGESPFPGEEDEEIFKNILRHTPDSSKLSTNVYSLITRLMQHEPTKRLGYGPNGSQKVKDHIFFYGVNWKQLYAKQLPAPFVPQLDSPADTQYFEDEFTSKPVTIEHDNPINDQEIDDLLFQDFDSSLID